MEGARRRHLIYSYKFGLIASRKWPATVFVDRPRHRRSASACRAGVRGRWAAQTFCRSSTHDSSILVSTFLLAFSIQLVIQITHDDLVSADERLMATICDPLTRTCQDGAQLPWSGQYLSISIQACVFFIIAMAISIGLTVTLALTRDEHFQRWSKVFGWLLMDQFTISTIILFKK